MKPYFQFSLLLFVLGSCGGHYRHVMFKTDEDAIYLKRPIAEAERNYVLKPFDKFSIKLFTNSGELILDPNFQFSRSMGVPQQQMQQNDKIIFEVRPNGTAFLPILGSVKVQGFTISELDSVLNKKYEENAYNDVFVISSIENNRVIVLGGTTGGMIIPLENNNMNLIEVLALYGGVDKYNKSNNIRLIRGDLKDPTVEVVDLSTIEGMQTASLNVQPNDIIYIEPVRRVLPETIAEVSPILGFFTSIATLIFIITQ